MSRFIDVDGLLASPAAYLPLARQIAGGEVRGLEPFQVSLVSSFTAEFLRSYVVVEGAACGLAVDLFIGGYAQVEQLCLDPESSLYQHRANAIVIALRLEDFLPALFDRAPRAGDRAQHIDAVLERSRNVIAHIRDNSDAAVLMWNFAPPDWVTAGLGDPHLEDAQIGTVHQINEALAALCVDFRNVYVFDLARLLAGRGLDNSLDRRMLYQCRMPFSAEAQRDIGRELARYFAALRRPPHKCLVLDLDGTMWGGVVGEDGIGGIALGEDYPGNAFKAFQKYVLALRERGVLLAIASKNNPEDAEQVFTAHPECPAKLKDFACRRIGWEDKPGNLRSIAEELNIGVDALVFFDDNPVERELMRREVPEVLVVEVPESPVDYIAALETSHAFDQLVLSEEDRRRSELYRDEQARDTLRGSSGSQEQFLHGLQMEAVCGAVDAATMPRVEQLLAKTNQFNLTTRRHTAVELEQMIAVGGIALWLRLSDRFGESGLVAVAIAVEEEGGDWLIDSLLLSCRVIGRGVEKVLLARLAALVKGRGGRRLVGEYIATAKNRSFSDTYANEGFAPMDENGDRWCLDLTDGDIAFPPFISCTFEGSTD